MRKALGDWHLHLCAAGAVMNIFMMMAANLVGFAVGLDGLKAMIEKTLQLDGVLPMLTVVIGLYTGAHCMFWERAKEQKLKPKRS